MDCSDVVVECKRVLSGGFLKLWSYTIKHRQFSGGRESINREAIVRAPSVGVLLFDPDLDVVVLVEQFRIGPYLLGDDPWLLEVVAGVSEDGENLEDVAYREVVEETNCKIKKLIPMFDFYMSPGASNEKLKLYCGIIDASNAGGVYGLAKEGEDIKVHVFPFEQVWSMVDDGRVANTVAIIAIQWLKLNHGELHGTC